MNNGTYEVKKNAVAEMLQQAYKKGLLEETCDEQGNDIIALFDDSGYRIIAAVYTADGSWVNSSAGSKKSNRRKYKKIVVKDYEYMCSNYMFVVITTGLLSSSNSKEYKRYKEFLKEGMEVNHMSGDTLDNSSDNLEVVSRKLNNLHARVMRDAHYYYPELIVEDVDCQGKKMHRFSDGKGISASKIYEIFYYAGKSIKADCRDGHMDAAFIWDVLKSCGKEVEFLG